MPPVLLFVAVGAAVVVGKVGAVVCDMGVAVGRGVGVAAAPPGNTVRLDLWQFKQPVFGNS